MNLILVLVFWIAFSAPASAAPAQWDPYPTLRSPGSHQMIRPQADPTWDSPALTINQIGRLKKAKDILREVNGISFEDAVSDLRHSLSPAADLENFEATALSYKEIVHEDKITTQEDKVGVYMALVLISNDMYASVQTNPRAQRIVDTFERNLSEASHKPVVLELSTTLKNGVYTHFPPHF